MLRRILEVALVLCVIATAGPAWAGNNAQYITQSVPSTMAAGQPYTVSVTMMNNGTTTWTSADSYHLGSYNPYDNWTWQRNRVALDAGESIAPGAQKQFTFTVTAPSTPGVYNFQWEMVQDGVEWFGVPSPNVVVTTAVGPNAQYVSQSVPSTMVTGQPYTVSVTMMNNGTTTWTSADSYHLGSYNPYDNWTWQRNRVALDAGESIAPGAQKQFTFTVTAPSTPGVYNFQWEMVQDGVEWFGVPSPNVVVTTTADVVANFGCVPPV